MNTTYKRLLLAGAFAIAGVAVASADDKPSDKAKAAETAAADVQKAKDQFSKQRDAMLSDRQKLVDQLKTATAEDRKKIIEQLQQQQKDFADQMRELQKQQRDEARKLRESSGKPGGGR